MSDREDRPQEDLPPLRAGNEWTVPEDDLFPTDDAAERPSPPAEKPPTPAPVEKEREFVGTGLFWGLVVGVLLATLVIVFSAQNTGDAPITFLGWHWASPVFAVILVSLLVGIVLDEIVGLLFRSRRRRRLAEREELKRLRKQGGR